MVLLARYMSITWSRATKDDVYSVRQAGRAAGHLLKRVLIEDTKRIYETRQGFTREYRWVGEEMLG